MSYILEALKKAEQQRDLGRVPGIDSLHEQPRRGTRRRWLWALTGVLIVNAAVLLVLFWPEQHQDSRLVAATPLLPATQAASAPQPAPARQALSAEPAQSEDRALPDADIALPPKLPVKTRDEPQRQTPVGGADAGGDRQIPARPQQAVAKPAAARRLPVWPQVPAYVFERLNGSLRLDVHVFAGQPADRFVLINLKKYHQGQQLQEGPRLDEITSDGVILSFQGEKFRLLAQQ